jgi:hypothetical protein
MLGVPLHKPGRSAQYVVLSEIAILTISQSFPGVAKTLAVGHCDKKIGTERRALRLTG